MSHETGLRAFPCRTCGGEVHVGMVSCRHCGAALGESLLEAEKTAAEWERIFTWQQCPDCGADYRKGMVRCRACRRVLGDEIVSEKAPAVKEPRKFSELREATRKFAETNLHAPSAITTEVDPATLRDLKGAWRQWPPTRESIEQTRELVSNLAAGVMDRIEHFLTKLAN